MLSNKEIQRRQTQSAEARRLLRINEAAIYAAISRATIYVEIKAGKLKLTKLGHASRIEISEMDRWIDSKEEV